MKISRLFGVVALTLLTSTVHAWDDNGHRQIADIAWTKLTPKAKAQIGKILRAGEGRFQPFNGSEEEAREAFRSASTFADYIKFTRTTKYEPLIDGMNKLFQPVPDPNDSESELCKTWHYHDTPIRFTGATPAIRESSALKAIPHAIKELKTSSTAPNPDRMRQCWWLYWIVHVVGDLHQPLHCVSNFEFEPKGDEGGNKFSIRNLKGSGKTRLHGFWDGGIGRAIGEENQRGLSGNIEEVSARWLADPLNQSPATLSTNLDIATWVKEGAQLAEAHVYTGIQRDTKPSDAYTKMQSALCKKQAVLGGLRLAAVLNQIFE
jgi:hypothetical protein